MPLVNVGTGLPVTGTMGYLTQPTGALAGMTQAQLQAALVVAQTAYVQLQAGGKPVTVSYTQGDGSKSVTYNMVGIGALQGWIFQLQRALGIVCVARRPMRPFF